MLGGRRNWRVGFRFADAAAKPILNSSNIRRLEEYGYALYRLDSQVLWNELTATAPEQARRQVTRTSVDFFIALLYGHSPRRPGTVCYIGR